MQTKFELDWHQINNDISVEDEIQQTIGNCSAEVLTHEHNSNATVLVTFNGTKDQLAKRLVEIDYYDKEDADYFKAEMKEIG